MRDGGAAEARPSSKGRRATTTRKTRAPYEQELDELGDAIENNDVEWTSRILGQVVDPNSMADTAGNTLLTLAAWCDAPTVARLLLSSPQNADPNLKAGVVALFTTLFCSQTPIDDS
jgi:hypothetical protein